MAEVINQEQPAPANSLRGDEALNKVAGLIKGEETPPSTSEAPPVEPTLDELLAGGVEAPPPEKPQFEALAESASLSVEDLYKVPVPMKNRDPMSLGALKDLADKQLQQEDWDQKRQESENNLLKQQQELAQAMELLGDKVTPELVEQARQKNEVYTAQQRQLLMNVMPQLSDPEVLQQTQDRVKSVLDGYGFSPQESAAVTDHRLIKMLSDYGELRGRFQQAAERMKAIKADAQPRSRKAPDQPAKPTQAKAQDSGTSFDKIPAVLDVLAKQGNEQ